MGHSEQTYRILLAQENGALKGDLFNRGALLKDLKKMERDMTEIKRFPYAN
jgi:hypothetical protein